jgi:hypothetical protein
LVVVDFYEPEVVEAMKFAETAEAVKTPWLSAGNFEADPQPSTLVSAIETIEHCAPGTLRTASLQATQGDRSTTMESLTNVGCSVVRLTSHIHTSDVSVYLSSSIYTPEHAVFAQAAAGKCAVRVGRGALRCASACCLGLSSVGYGGNDGVQTSAIELKNQY